MIITSSASSFYHSLRAAISDRGANSLTEVAECAAKERDLEFKESCVAALACWGDAGFKRMIANALNNGSYRDTFAAMKTLATIAAGKSISAPIAFIDDNIAFNQINDAISGQNLSMIARRNLSELIMALSRDDLLTPLGVAFTHVALADPAVAGEIVRALTSKWLGFGLYELDAFGNLLEESPEDEPALHAFLETYPQMLDPMAVQVWSKPDFHGFKEPDFLIRRSDNSYLVVEIENAAKLIMTQADQPSAYVTQAVKQVNEYRSFILEGLVDARHHFLDIHDPDALVVIGLENNLTPSQAKALQQENRSRNKLRIVGFDWILGRSRVVLSNVTSSEVEVVKNYRVV
jgi:Domain of unknown function (DUF4263)